MIRTFFRVLFKFLMALGAITAVLGVLYYLADKKTDYIEIYNDDDEGDLF